MKCLVCLVSKKSNPKKAPPFQQQELPKFTVPWKARTSSNKLVEDIKNTKQQKAKEKEEKEAARISARENFFRCKEGCVCKSKVCKAAKLKQCPSCDSVMRSICSKSKCIVDGKKPTMISIKSTTRKAAKSTTALASDDDLSYDDLTDESDTDEESSEETELESALNRDIKELRNTWNSLSPPNPELKEKWFAVEYRGKRRGQLLIAKLLHRFLVDKDGNVDRIVMNCLKPKVGSGNVLDEAPKHLPDIWDFELKDVIKGPIEVQPKGSTQFIVPDYENIVCYYRRISAINWRAT